MKRKLKMNFNGAAILVALFLFLGSVGYAQETPKLSDAEVAHVAVVANQIDID